MDPFDSGDCFDDPSCSGGDWGFYLPPIGISTPSQAQIPPPRPAPAPMVIQNTTGVYAQGQWGGFLDKNDPNVNGPSIAIALGTAVCALDEPCGVGGSATVGHLGLSNQQPKGPAPTRIRGKQSDPIALQVTNPGRGPMVSAGLAPPTLRLGGIGKCPRVYNWNSLALD